LLDRRVPADTYNLASGRATTIQEVLDQLIARAKVDPRIERDPGRWRETDWLVGDASRLRNATGWKPTIYLEAILEELYVDWLTKEEA
jgi:GDP-4-dehydro-6-deoxy-D-mannose reductase